MEIRLCNLITKNRKNKESNKYEKKIQDNYRSLGKIQELGTISKNMENVEIRN